MEGLLTEATVEVAGDMAKAWDMCPIPVLPKMRHTWHHRDRSHSDMLLFVLHFTPPAIVLHSRVFASRRPNLACRH
jgi:hypothetical protein